jgi:hypothetical protein
MLSTLVLYLHTFILRRNIRIKFLSDCLKKLIADLPQMAIMQCRKTIFTEYAGELFLNYNIGSRQYDQLSLLKISQHVGQPNFCQICYITFTVKNST